MGNVPLYAQFLLAALGLVGNVVSIIVAGRWLVALGRRENEIQELRRIVQRQAEHLIAKGILPPA